MARRSSSAASALPPTEASLLLEAESELSAEAQRRNSYRLKKFFPDCLPGCKPLSLVKGNHVIRPGYITPTCRVLYGQFVKFFAMGSVHRERLLIAANRVGKSESGAYELTLHLTGEYPPWWTGRRFDMPIQAWAAGDTGKTTRDIIQEKLLGKLAERGTGMIPKHLIYHCAPKAGLQDAVETIWVRHRTGGLSIVHLKSYDQRRISFQGTAQHVVWLDEEPPDDIYTECLLRTMDSPDLPGGGILYMTFTPLQGLTELVLKFLPNAGKNDKELDEKRVRLATDEEVAVITRKRKTGATRKKSR